jgi:O-antigen ligase
MWGEHPWLGVGAGNYEVVYDRYALPLWPLPLGHAHNYYLNIAAEAGILGLGTYLLLWLAALVAAWRATRRTAGWSWGVALGVLGVLVHLSVHNVFDNLYVHGMYLHVAILLGILCPLGTLPSVTGRSDDLGSNLDGI